MHIKKSTEVFYHTRSLKNTFLEITATKNYGLIKKTPSIFKKLSTNWVQTMLLLISFHLDYCRYNLFNYESTSKQSVQVKDVV